MTFFVCLLCPKALSQVAHRWTNWKAFSSHPKWSSWLKDIIHQWFPFQEQKLNLSSLDNATVMKVPSKLKETQQMGYKVVKSTGEPPLWEKWDWYVCLSDTEDERFKTSPSVLMGKRAFQAISKNGRWVHASSDDISAVINKKMLMVRAFRWQS